MSYNEDEAYRDAVENDVLNDPMNEAELVYQDDAPITDAMEAYTYFVEDGEESPDWVDDERTAFNIRCRYMMFRNYIEAMEHRASVWDLPITGWAETITCDECGYEAARKGIRLTTTSKRPVWEGWEEHERLGGDVCHDLCPDCTDDPDWQHLTTEDIVSSPMWKHRYRSEYHPRIPEEMSVDWRENVELMEEDA